MTGAQIKSLLVTTGYDNASLVGKTSSGKRVNAYKALFKFKTTQKKPKDNKSSGGCFIN